MLALERTLGVVADLALFGDHADPKRIYYICARPRLARAPGGAPELAFVKFRDSDARAGGVGLLSFTTELIASDQQLEAARDRLVRQGVSEPLLVQVPWVRGKAYLAAALAEGDGFVEKLLGEVTPDLAATNRATFSVRLTEDGARLVESLVKMEGPNPLGVRYELEYAGLRPALDVRIRADFKRIYQELSWGFEIGVAYEGVGVRASVESATQKLVQAGAIQIEVMHFTDSADLRNRVDEAIRWFEEKILEDFFKSSLQPPAHENLLQRAIDAAKQMGASLQDALKDVSMAERLAKQLGVSPDALNRVGQGAGAGGSQGGAAGSQSTFALKLQFTFRDIKQDELKTLTLDWREARAETRTAAPQGLFSRFGAQPVIVEPANADRYWEKLNVHVRPLGDFAALGVHDLVVQLAYPDEGAPEAQQSFTFAPGQTEPGQFCAWTSGKPPQYRGRAEVHFDDQGPWPGPPEGFVGGWRTLQSLDLAVHPLSDVPRVEVELAPGSISFDQTPQVQVDLRIDGTVVATHMLTAARPTSVFRRRLAPRMPPQSGAPAPTPCIEARPTWFLAGGGRAEGEWTPVEGSSWLVHAPWRSTRTIRLVPLLPRDFIDALVTVTLVDGGRAQTVETRFEAGDRRAKTVAIPCLSEQPPPAQVDVLVIRGDGSTFAGQPFETSDPVVIVRDREGAVRQVSVRLLAGPSLASLGLMAVHVKLLDEAGGQLDGVVFTESARNPALLLVPAEEDSPPARYCVVRYALNGAPTEGPVQNVAGSEILVPAVTQP